MVVEIKTGASGIAPSFSPLVSRHAAKPCQITFKMPSQKLGFSAY